MGVGLGSGLERGGHDLGRVRARVKVRVRVEG